MVQTMFDGCSLFHLVSVDMVLTQLRSDLETGGLFYRSPLPSVMKRGIFLMTFPLPAEAYPTFTQTSGTAVSCRRRLTPGGHSAAKAAEVMSDKEGLFQEVEAIGGVNRLEYAGPSLALAHRCSLPLSVGSDLHFLLVPFFLPFLLHSLTVHNTVFDAREESEAGVTSTFKDPAILCLE